MWQLLMLRCPGNRCTYRPAICVCLKLTFRPCKMVMRKSNFLQALVLLQTQTLLLLFQRTCRHLQKKRFYYYYVLLRLPSMQAVALKWKNIQGAAVYMGFSFFSHLVIVLKCPPTLEFHRRFVNCAVFSLDRTKVRNNHISLTKICHQVRDMRP